MTVNIDVDLQGWRSDIADLKKDLHSIDDGKEFNIGVDTEDAESQLDDLVGKEREVKVKANIDGDSLDDLKDMSDLELDFGDMEDQSISIEADVDDDDPLIKALRGEKDLETSGTVRWSSYGGHRPGGRTSGTVEWESEVDVTDLIGELKLAKREAKAMGANKIEWEVEPDDSGDLDTMASVLDRMDEGSSSRTFRTSEYTNYEARTDWDSFEEAKGQLKKLRKQVRDEGLLEHEIEVCVERCDNWKENLQNIYKDLDALEDWNERNGDIEIRLGGNLDEIGDVIDRLEESDLDLSKRRADGGGAGLLDGMGMSEMDMFREYMGIDSDEGNSGDSDGDSDKPDWQKDLSDSFKRQYVGEHGIRIGDDQDVDRLKRAMGGNLDRIDKDLDNIKADEVVVLTADDIKANDANINDAILQETGDAGNTEHPTRNFYKGDDEVQSRAREIGFENIVGDFQRQSRFEARSQYPVGGGGFKGLQYAGSHFDDVDVMGHSRRSDMGMRDVPLTGNAGSLGKKGGLDYKLWDTDGDFKKDIKKLRKGIRGIIPTMAKYWQFIAMLAPALAGLAVNALGVAGAFATVAGAGATVMGLGLLGFGNSLSDSMEEAQQRVKALKVDLYEVFSGTFTEFSMFTDDFMTTMPIRVKPLADSLKGLTAYTGDFNAMFDGLVDWTVKLIDTLVSLQPVISMITEDFGRMIGNGIIEFIRWLTIEAAKNKDLMVQLGTALLALGGALYNLAMLAARIVAAFTPVAGIFQWLTALLNNGLVVAIGVATAAFYALTAISWGAFAKSAAGAIWTVIGALYTLGAELATAIGLQATLMGMSVGGLAMVATGLAAGYMAYQQVKPDNPEVGSFSSPSGVSGGSGGSSGSGFSGGGGGVVNRWSSRSRAM